MPGVPFPPGPGGTFAPADTVPDSVTAPATIRPASALRPTQCVDISRLSCRLSLDAPDSPRCGYRTSTEPLPGRLSCPIPLRARVFVAPTRHREALARPARRQPTSDLVFRLFASADCLGGTLCEESANEVWRRAAEPSRRARSSALRRERFGELRHSGVALVRPAGAAVRAAG